MRICYKILTHNETDSLEKLLDFLFENTKETDHIIVCDDFSEARCIVDDGFISIQTACVEVGQGFVTLVHQIVQ